MAKECRHPAMQEWAEMYEDKDYLGIDPSTKKRVAKLAKRIGWEEVDLAMQLLCSGLRVAEGSPGVVMYMQMPYTPYHEFVPFEMNESSEPQIRVVETKGEGK